MDPWADLAAAVETRKLAYLNALVRPFTAGMADQEALVTANRRGYQSAIDWDNVLVLLYPYLWDTRPNEQEKLLLSHPDPLHRDFLRAGSARVILAIQPGNEEDVVSLLQEGQFGALGQGTAFAKVVKDVREANAAYGRTAPSATIPVSREFSSARGTTTRRRAHSTSTSRSSRSRTAPRSDAGTEPAAGTGLGRRWLFGHCIRGWMRLC